jgi:hypothetical protein
MLPAYSKDIWNISMIGPQRDSPSLEGVTTTPLLPFNLPLAMERPHSIDEKLHLRCGVVPVNWRAEDDQISLFKPRIDLRRPVQQVAVKPSFLHLQQSRQGRI